jgi:transposase InsO family protein
MVHLICRWAPRSHRHLERLERKLSSHVIVDRIAHHAFHFVEGWYNPKRRHSALDYFSPLEFERINQTPMRASA